jgi:putative heme-binding domain-containing protein
MTRIWTFLAIGMIAVTSLTARAQTPTGRADARMKVRDGLWLWLDARVEPETRREAGLEPLAIGQGIDCWHDVSGHGRHQTQRLRAARPTWEEGAEGAALRFDGDDFLSWSGGPQPAPREATVILVAAPVANVGGFNGLVSMSREGADDFVSGLNVDLGIRSGESWSTLNVEGVGQPGVVDLMKADVPLGRFHVVAVRTRPGPAGTEVRFDGLSQGTRARGDGKIGMDEVTIGARFNRFGPTPGDRPFVQQFFRGRIAEILIFERALRDDELRAVEGYLRGKHEAKPGGPGVAALVGRPAVPADAPFVQMLVPGFVVRELPVELTNINNVAFAPDGRLFAAGYDGRLHLLRDTDGDGLEDKVTTFLDKKSEDYPLGIAYRDRSLYVVSRYQIARHDDTDGDGVPDHEATAARWEDPTVPKALLDPRRVSGGLGLAIGPDGSLYTSTGSLNTFNSYMLARPDGKPPGPGESGTSGVVSHYDLRQTAGAVLRFAPKSTRPEIVATGVRYLTSLQFNRHGDLFATDQEGATWLPNGNPFDELLEIRDGRHYGFPPRHPKFLPHVIDEPSIFDYAPQHQSTCGFRFNEATPRGRTAWGPAFWTDDAIVTGESRGKLFRTKLVKTAAGYVAQNQIIACLGMLPVDVALSPTGDLVVACHGGEPDWGNGPAGRGRLFKISYVDSSAPQPVAGWAASPTETWIEFDKPLKPEEWKNLSAGTRVEGGPYVAAGDRFERLRPGYAVVQRQSLAPRYEYPIVSAALGEDGRSVLIRTPARTSARSFSITLPAPGSAGNESKRILPRSSGIDLGVDLTGVQADWRPVEGSEAWSGWLPHLDWKVASELTAASALHARLRALVARPGVLTLSGQLDLGSMLHPAVQPGSKLDYAYPDESVSVDFVAGSKLTLVTGGPGRAEAKNATLARLAVASKESTLIPFTLSVVTGDKPLNLSATWSTAEDPRPRALPLRRMLLPWVTPSGNEPTQPSTSALVGGDWSVGKTLFFGDKLKCASCHIMRGEGGKIGPELTNLIHRDYDSVMKDIRQPSAAINPDFLSYSVELADGRILTGVLHVSIDAELKIGGTDGKTTTIPRKEVAAVMPSRTSIMPERILDGLTEKQVKDLMTYLLSERPAAAPR